MDNDNSPDKRPTFKRALRNISMTSIFITMTLIWLLLSVTSVLTLKQYAHKNLTLTAATMTYSLEAAVVFADGLAATETLAALGQQGQFSTAEVRDNQHNIIASWHYTAREPGDTFSNFISHWLFPAPVIQPIRHNDKIIGEVQLTARDSSISHFIWFSLAVLTSCILLASGIAITLTRHLHNGLVEALKNITDVVHDVRSNRNFSRRVSEERIEEFHRFALDFNSLLDEMEEWQLRLQAKNAQLLRTSLHDSLTGLANRAAFRSSINALMNDSDTRKTSALLFLDGDNFKYINDTWGHATGDQVLIAVAKRLTEFAGKRHQAYRIGGDEFALVLYSVQSEYDVQHICTALTQTFNQPFDLHNGHSLLLTGCQSPQGKFTPEQIAAMQSYGFTESAGDWSLGLSDTILFAKNDYKLLPESQQQIQTMAAKLSSTGLKHARMDGHTDNYGEDSYNEALSLKRANVVADAWATGGQIPRSNLTTQGLGKKYPVASNKTAQGRAENRRVAVVINTP